ncbi:MAG: hypothetical protein QXV84_04285 [Conexivisphaerales archaeon]
MSTTIEIADNQVIMTVGMNIYNFDIDDIRSLAKYDFTAKFDKEPAGVLVFMRREEISLSYKQSKQEKIAPGYVALSRNLVLNRESYRNVNKSCKGIKEKVWRYSVNNRRS